MGFRVKSEDCPLSDGSGLMACDLEQGQGEAVVQRVKKNGEENGFGFVSHPAENQPDAEKRDQVIRLEMKH